ncbi:MAG TPA: hypothetical protein VFD43_09835, partial [Planctomycetota bacterium]|nr:hypothetical protein [Planctomycetota bacterium]
TIRSFKLARVSRRLDAAPEIEDKSRLDAAWLARLDEGTLAPAGGEPADTPAPGAAQPAQPAQPAPSDDAPLPLLGALAGRTALDAAGQPAGTIVDVVVAVPKARLAYVVVLLRGEPDGADSLHAVPLAALGSTDDDESVRLKLSLPELRDAPRIDALARLPIDPLQTEEPQATPR